MLLSNLNLLATASGGVARLRDLILTLAVQGKLVPQDAKDEPASALLKKIRAEKDRLIAEGKIKRDKPLAEIAEEEKPFGLPKGWEWVRWADIAMKIGDIDHKMPSEVTDGVPYVSPRDFYGKNEIDFAGAKKIARSDFLDLASKIRPEKGDLIYPRYGTIGVIRMVMEDREFLASYSCAVIKVLRGCIEPSYQYLLSMSDCVKRQAASATNKTTQPNVGLKSIQEYLVPLPPLAEQSRIVTRVEELMRLCDALEAKGQLEATQHAQLVSTLLATLTDSETPAQLADNWHRIATRFDLLLDRPEAVDALEQTILQLAVRGLLVPQDPQDEPASELLKKIRAEKDKLIVEGKIKRDKPLPPIAEDEQPFALPLGWEWTQTGYLVNDSEAGWSPTCIGSPRRSGHWGVLKVSAVSWGAFDANANKELPADLAPRPEYEVQDGDFLLSRANTEELVARSVVVGTAEPKLMLSDKIIRLEVSGLMNRDFLNLCNNSSHARVHYVANASGTSSSMKNVSREVVLRTPIPLPPLVEQSRIVTRVAQLRRLCADLRQRLTASQSTQAHLAEALVQEVA
jgi:type I restriction enzyme, S subunit